MILLPYRDYESLEEQTPSVATADSFWAGASMKQLSVVQRQNRVEEKWEEQEHLTLEDAQGVNFDHLQLVQRLVETTSEILVHKEEYESDVRGEEHAAD